MNAIIRAVYTIVLLLCLFLTWILAWLIQTITRIAMLPFSDVHQRNTACSRIFRTMNFFTMDLFNPFWDVRVLRPMPKIPSGEKYLVIMNHLSNADPWVVLRLLVFSGNRDWKFVCKGSLFKVPFGGWALRNNGDLEVKFTKEKGGWGTEKGSVRQLLDDAVETIEHGSVVAIYPEGVRNPNPKGAIGEFKPGFFQLAVERGYKILPIALSGAEDCWPLHDWKLDAATVHLTCGDLISPEGHDTESLKKLVHDKITKMRDTHPDRRRNN